MKKAVLILLLLLPIVLAQPFGPPLYIGNPETGECKYYFAGDPDHFNERPEGFPDNIGPTTDFEDQAQACAVYSCFIADGGFDLDNNQCVCNNGQIFNNNTMESCPAGEIEIPLDNENNELTGSATQEGSEGVRLDRILILVLAVALVAHFIYSRIEIAKLKNNKPEVKTQEVKEPEPEPEPVIEESTQEVEEPVTEETPVEKAIEETQEPITKPEESTEETKEPETTEESEEVREESED